MSTPIATAEDADRRFVFHPFTQLDRHEQVGSPTMIVEGSGACVTDIHGRTYIDAMAGLWCVNVGYGRKEIADTLQEHAGRLGYYHAFSSMGTDQPGLLAERLIEMAPSGMSKVFFGCTGSDANDTQVKLVWFYNNVLGRPEKKKIIARQRGYHGVSVMSAGLTGFRGMHENFDLPLAPVRQLGAATAAPVSRATVPPRPGRLRPKNFAIGSSGRRGSILSSGPTTVPIVRAPTCLRSAGGAARSACSSAKASFVLG